MNNLIENTFRDTQINIKKSNRYPKLFLIVFLLKRAFSQRLQTEISKLTNFVHAVYDHPIMIAIQQHLTLETKL